MSAVSLLCEIIAQGGRLASDYYSSDQAFDALVTHGFLSKAGVLASVVCDDCDAPHSAPVGYDGDGYGYYCPDLGFVPLDPALLTTVKPDIPLLIRRLAVAFECRQRKSSSIHGQTWRIGTVETASTPITLYFHPTLQSEDDLRDLQSALGREARSEWRLVVTSQGALPMTGLTAVRLDDLVEIDVQTGDVRRIADTEVLLGVPRKNPGGRPSVHGDLLKPLIEKRIRTGEAVEAVNAESRAIRTAFQTAHPDKPIPSESAIKRYIREARGGS